MTGGDGVSRAMLRKGSSTMADMTDTVIKVTSFGETRFMKATLLHDGATLHIAGFAAKLGRGAKVHCVWITIPTSRISEDGSYNVAYHASQPYILGRHGVLIGFWGAGHDANASGHIHSQGGTINNVPDPAIEAAEQLAILAKAADIVLSERQKGRDVFFGTSEFAQIASGNMVSPGDLYDYMNNLPLEKTEGVLTCDFICHLCAKTWKRLYDADNADVPRCPACGTDHVMFCGYKHVPAADAPAADPAPAPEELPCVCEYICRLCAHVWKAPFDADNADVPACPACRSGMSVCTSIKSDPRPACDQPEQSLPDLIRAAVEEYGFGRFLDATRQYADAKGYNLAANLLADAQEAAVSQPAPGAHIVTGYNLGMAIWADCGTCQGKGYGSDGYFCSECQARHFADQTERNRQEDIRNEDYGG